MSEPDKKSGEGPDGDQEASGAGMDDVVNGESKQGSQGPDNEGLGSEGGGGSASSGGPAKEEGTATRDAGARPKVLPTAAVDGRGSASSGEGPGTAATPSFRDSRESASHELAEEASASRLRPLDHLLTKLDRVFVAPPGLLDRTRALLEVGFDKRVFAVVGPRRSGRGACALHVGAALLAKQSVLKPGFFGRPPAPSGLDSILDVASSEEIPRDSIILMENGHDAGAFEGVLPDDLQSIYGLLRKRGSFIAITIDDSGDELFRRLGLEAIELGCPPLKDVLDRHLDYHVRGYSLDPLMPIVADTLRDAWGRIEPLLRTPPQIDEFCQRLAVRSRSTGTPNAESARHAVDQLIQDADDTSRRPVAERFRELGHEARVLALLTALFEGLDRNDLRRIHAEALRALRVSGQRIDELRDPRLFGFDDLLDSIQARADEADRIVFDNPDVRREARRQLGNHTLLLWSVAEAFMDLIEHHFAGRESVQTRALLAFGIAQVGAQELPGLLVLLRRLARSPMPGVRSAAGYLLLELCHSRPTAHPGAVATQLDFVVETLEGWAQRPLEWGALVEIVREKWTVAAAFWRVFVDLQRAGGGHEADKGWVRRLCGSLRLVLANARDLKRTAEEFRKEEYARRILAFIAAGGKDGGADANKLEAAKQVMGLAADLYSSVAFALQSLARSAPRTVMDLLTEWGADADDVTDLLIEDLLPRLFGSPGIGRDGGDGDETAREIQLIRSRHEPVLEKLPALLRSRPQCTSAILGRLAGWIGSDSSWDDTIARALIRAANRCTQRSGQMLLGGLYEHWLNHGDDHPRQIGARVAARTRWSLGWPMELPGGLRVLLGWDGPPRFRASNFAEVMTVARGVQRDLEAIADTFVFRLGSAQVLDGVEQRKMREVWASDYALAPLLMPILEKAEPARHLAVVALSPNTVIDIADLAVESDAADGVVATWKAHTIVVDGGGGAPVAQHLSWSTAKEGPWRKKLLWTLRTWLHNSLLERSFEAWNRLLEPLLGRAVPTAAHAMAEVVELLSRTDELPSDPDAGRLMTGLTLAAASADLVGCVEWLVSLLDDREAADAPGPVGQVRTTVGEPSSATATSDRRVADQLEDDSESGAEPPVRVFVAVRLAAAVLRAFAPSQSGEAGSTDGASPPPPIPFGRPQPLLALLARLGESSAAEVELVLDIARDYAFHPEWALWLLADRPLGLLSKLATLPRGRTRAMQEVIARLREGLPLAAVGRFGPREVLDEIEFHLALGSARPRESGLATKARILIVVGEPFASQQSTVVTKLWQRLQSRTGTRKAVASTIVPELYRLGLSQPIAVGRESVSSAKLGKLPGEPRAPLLGPLFDEIEAENVVGVALIAGTVPLDVEDWRDRWAGRIVVCPPMADSSWGVFTEIVTRFESDGRPRSADSVVDELLEYLARVEEA